MSERSEFWLSHLSAIEAEGITTKAYAQREGLSPQALYQWRKRLVADARPHRTQRGGFAAIQIEPSITVPGTHSWSAVKLDLYGLKLFTTHVLKKPWAMPDLIKPPKTQRLPDIVTVDEAQRLFLATRVLSYRVFYFTLYSLGLRLGEGLALTVADIDAERMRVQVRDAKGNRDRLVPLPQSTLAVLRRFWLTHRHPELLFPNRSAGLKGAQRASSPLDRGGVQLTWRKVATACGLKKRSPLTVCATAMPRT